ncbi:hypothetical protein [Dyella agri]|uniref:DUF2259 domain-containing protein n=1 Tax=Dyella agri TaxID=1926869 RepID=A0ABW8KF53_9GAMM
MPRIVAVAASACLALAAPCLAADKPARPVIEDTYIIAPRSVGEYALVETVNYGEKGELLAGAALRYRDKLLPSMAADIYVYPGGDNETLEHAEQTFRDSVKSAATHGIYSDVRWGEPQGYELQQHDGSAWQGRMIPMQVHHQQDEAASRTYLFHHGLYDYKLRVDVPASEAADLPAAADALLRSVLPAVQVVSVGGCGKQMNIDVMTGTAAAPAGYVDGVAPDGFGIAIRETDLNAAAASSSKAPPEDNAVVKLTLLAAQRQIAHGCTSFPFEPQGDNVAVLKLHYPADFWQSGPANPGH